MTVTVPKGVSLSVDNAAMMVDVGTNLQFVRFSDIRDVYGSVGSVGSSEIELSGEGELELGNVTGVLRTEINGSADVRGGTVGALDAFVHGSGDLDLEDIKGPAMVRIKGSAISDLATSAMGWDCRSTAPAISKRKA